MDIELVKKKIEELGHRVVMRPLRFSGMTTTRRRFSTLQPTPRPFVAGVSRDKKGEFFDIQVNENTKITLLDTDGDHALLLFKTPNENPHQPPAKDRIMIGHDERQLFIAGIPDSAGPSTIFQAKESLKPIEVREFEKKIGVKDKQARHARGKKVSLKRRRQGDFFFIPKPDMEFTDEFINRKEPIGRNIGTSHICEELVRTGGENIYTTTPRSLDMKTTYTEKEREELFKDNPKARNWGWIVRRGGDSMSVYVRGSIRHPEHATVILDVWHEVVSNTEFKSSAMSNITFLD